MFFKRRFGFLFTCLFFTCLAARAMDIRVESGYVIASGQVLEADLAKITDAFEKNPGVTTLVLKDSLGGHARTGYAVGEYVREKGIDTLLSGYCYSSCSRMFLGGKNRGFLDEQSLKNTFVAFHGNYANDGRLMRERMPALKDWIIKHSDGKAAPDLVEQWVNLENRNGFAYFHHPNADLDYGPNKVILCPGTESPRRRHMDCTRPDFGDALANGIVTSLQVVSLKSLVPKAVGQGKPP